MRPTRRALLAAVAASGAAALAVGTAPLAGVPVGAVLPAAGSGAVAGGSAPALAKVTGNGEGEPITAVDPRRDYATSTPVTTRTVAGHTARVDLRTLHSAKPVPKVAAERPKPRPIDGTKPTGGGKPGGGGGKPGGGGGGTADPYLQTSAPTTGLAPTVSFSGMSLSANGAGWPPDTVGAVGPYHFVQAVNTSIHVFTKDGASASPAVTFDAFFPDTSGTPCDSSNQGDPTVNYDKQSGRWVIADFAWAGSYTSGPYYQCLAVSAPGADPTSAQWTFYAIEVSASALNDYPKVASGPDALFITSNLFTSGSAYAGTKVMAISRATLGGTLVVKEATTGTAYGALLAANIDPDVQSSQVPATADERLVSLGNTALELWTFHTGFSDSTAPSFAGPVNAGVRAYTAAGQIATPGERVDSLSDRVMNLAQYRDGHLFVAHSVVAGSGAGVRWYDVDLSTNKVALQSTFAPGSGSPSRWMPALAVGKDGSLAIGYSVASSSTYPGLRISGATGSQLAAQRNTTARAGSLTYGEATLVNGTGAPRRQYNRWGDYAQMTVDADGCTAWFTSEWYATTGNNWQTRIGSVKLPGCA